jgi:diguanylate cyclase (GGDEF)-like protein
VREAAVASPTLPRVKNDRTPTSETHLLDALTGAGSRGAFDRDWPDVARASQGAGDSCGLLFFDIDHFKSINDAFGHGRGDEALREVVRRVREVVRASDRLYRYGGDEFALVLPAAGKAEATELARRVLEAVRQPMGDDGLVVGLSVGVASLPEDGEEPVALLERADARNYEAKRQGRARIVAQESAPDEGLPFATLSRRVERDVEHAQARDFLAALRVQGRGVLAVSGPAGSGRSAMLADVRDLARLQGWHVVELAATPRLRGHPHAALVRALPRFAPAAGMPGDVDALAALLRADMNAAGATCALLCIDNLQHLDWPTLYLIRQVMSAEGFPVLGVAGASDEESAQAVALLPAPLHAQVTLRPFGKEGLRIWLRLLLHWDPPAEFMAWLDEQTGRLPGAVERVLRRLLARGLLSRAGSEDWSLHDDYARGVGDDAAPWRPAEGRHNLPLQLTSFVGRDAELEEVRRAVHRSRMSTLTGPGGTGKTRLAVRTAGDLVRNFRHGAWFVDLAGVRDAEGVAIAAADVLGVRKARGRPVQASVAAWLARKQLLLVLDNCEHLLPACAALAYQVLRTAPEVRVLATSREPLGVEGEQALPVPPLSMPASEVADPRELLRFEAVRLFVERAVLAWPGFVLDDTVAGAVREICRHLDGIPLAIELAAARLRHLSPEQIAQRLDDRFALLTGGSGTDLPRQRTLRALVDWSHDLLAPPEQVLLRRLAVFVGGCTLETAEEVCCGLAPLAPRDALTLLSSLVDKSLVVIARSAQGGTRYQMLETIRLYALEKLETAGETAGMRTRHLHAMAALAERCEPGVCGREQQRWLERLDAETGDLQAAIAWGEAHDAGALLRLASSLWRYSDLRGQRVIGLDTLVRALRAGQRDATHAVGLARAAYMARNLADFALADQLAGESLAITAVTPAPQAEAMALFIRGAAALELMRGEAGRRDLARALELARATGDDGLAGTALVFMGFEAEMRNDLEAARRLMTEGLRSAQRGGDRRRIGHALVRLAFVAIAADDGAQALRHCEEVLELAQAIGDRSFRANGLYLLGRAAAFTGDFPRARQLLNEVIAPCDGAAASEIAWAQLELARIAWAHGELGAFEAALEHALSLAGQAGLDEVRATAMVLLGHVARERGDAPQAWQRAAEALAIFRRTRPEGLCFCVELWAGLAADAGDAATATRWLGARESLRERHFALDHYPFMRLRRATLSSRLRERLGDADYETAWAAGRALGNGELADIHAGA